MTNLLTTQHLLGVAADAADLSRREGFLRMSDQALSTACRLTEAQADERADERRKSKEK